MGESSVYSRIVRALADAASPRDASVLRSFFKTGKGEYGEGDVFVGVRVPKIHAIVKRHGDDATDVDITELLASAIHEERLCGLLVLVRRFERGDERVRELIARMYRARLDRVNNWDLVDLTAYKILGAWLVDKDRLMLYKLAASSVMWHRRVAVVACLAFIKRGDFGDIFALCARLLSDTHDLMHKACGWMLREVGKRDAQALRFFLKKNYARMPRTMLRYAIERFDAAERALMLKGRF